MTPRVLVLTASVGEGHDRPARLLAEQIHREQPDAVVTIEDCLPALGRVVAALSAGAPRIVFYRFLWLWDLGFWFFVRSAVTRPLTQSLLTRLGTPGLLRLIARLDPDVIVSVYPNVTEILGRLRRSDRIDVPVVAGITDLAGMHYWASRGVDVHLLTHPESVQEVRQVIGGDGPIHCVHGFTSAEFLEPRPQADARRELGLPEEGNMILVSGGGWGVGDILGAIEITLRLDEVAHVVCLCGRNDALRAQLAARFAGDERVRVEGFTEQMSDWMAAADALVHSTGGLTVLEALMRGCPAISYGWGRGHLRLNNEAFLRFGLAQVAGTPVELLTALRRALAGGRTVTSSFVGLPSAASFVLEAADAA
ncbi:MAG: glycosyltransferase [Actinobacteria bacterium]|nr:glycosyltransferase [Actinomycetota bacterium]